LPSEIERSSDASVSSWIREAVIILELTLLSMRESADFGKLLTTGPEDFGGEKKPSTVPVLSGLLSEARCAKSDAYLGLLGLSK
jgi:hypothetical protein